MADQGLLHDRQRTLHARITEAIERLSPERVAEQAERLAHHALRGELWEKAVAYLRQAGPSAARFVQDYTAGSPLAGHVAKVSDEARAALVREVGNALTPYLAGGALTFPIEAHLASAKRG